MADPVAIRPREAMARRGESSVETVRRLEGEARDVALHAAADLRRDMEGFRQRCVEVAELSSVPTGQREVFRKLAERLETDLTAIQAIGVRAG